MFQRTVTPTAVLIHTQCDRQLSDYTLHVAEDFEADCSRYMLQGRSALWVAANKGQADILQLLLSHGAAINAADQEVPQQPSPVMFLIERPRFRFNDLTWSDGQNWSIGRPATDSFGETRLVPHVPSSS